VSRGTVYVSIQGSGQASRQGDSGLDTALFDAPELIDGHVSPPGQLGDTQAQGPPLVIHGLAKAGAWFADYAVIALGNRVVKSRIPTHVGVMGMRAMGCGVALA
jgi:hypothetical protein